MDSHENTVNDFPAPDEYDWDALEKQCRADWEKEEKSFRDALATELTGMRYAGRRVQEFLSRHGEKEWSEKCESFLPPRVENKVVDFARETFPRAQTHFFPLLKKAIALRATPSDSATLDSLVHEWEGHLQSTHTKVMAFHSTREQRTALSLLHAHRSLRQKISQTQLEKRKVAREMDDYATRAHEQKKNILEMENNPFFTPVRELILNHARMEGQKKALEEAWMETWSRLAPALEAVVSNPTWSQKLENVQLQLAHVYLKNPQQARSRDAHASGIIAILSRVEETVRDSSESILDMSAEEIETRVHEARLSNVLTDFFWSNNACDAETQQILKELHALPAYTDWEARHHKLRESEKNAERARAKMETLSREEEEAQKSLRYTHQALSHALVREHKNALPSRA